jgi:hypothetical protein
MLAAPEEAPLQYHPDHRRRPCRRRPRTRHLIKMEKAHYETEGDHVWCCLVVLPYGVFPDQSMCSSLASATPCCTVQRRPSTDEAARPRIPVRPRGSPRGRGTLGGARGRLSLFYNARPPKPPQGPLRETHSNSGATGSGARTQCYTTHRPCYCSGKACCPHRELLVTSHSATSAVSPVARPASAHTELHPPGHEAVFRERSPWGIHIGQEEPVEPLHDIHLGRIVKIANSFADGAGGVLSAARGVRSKVAEPGMAGP